MVESNKRIKQHTQQQQQQTTSINGSCLSGLSDGIRCRSERTRTIAPSARARYIRYTARTMETLSERVNGIRYNELTNIYVYTNIHTNIPYHMRACYSFNFFQCIHSTMAYTHTLVCTSIFVKLCFLCVPQVNKMFLFSRSCCCC